MNKPTEQFLLAIETSGACGSVALQRAADEVHVCTLSEQRRQTAELLPVVERLLAEHGARLRDLTLFAFSCGPGSFTGLRVGATVARMVHAVVGCPVVAVPTLEVVAEGAAGEMRADERLLVLLNAGRGQVYAAAYERDESGTLHAVFEAVIQNAEDALARVAPPFLVVGDGVAQHHAACASAGGRIGAEAVWIPSASVVARIAKRRAAAGQFTARDEIRPLYIRPPACEEVYEQRRAAARARRGE